MMIIYTGLTIAISALISNAEIMMCLLFSRTNQGPVGRTREQKRELNRGKRQKSRVNFENFAARNCNMIERANSVKSMSRTRWPGDAIRMIIRAVDGLYREILCGKKW